MSVSQRSRDHADIRRCLRCRRPWLSPNAGHRICPRCTEINDLYRCYSPVKLDRFTAEFVREAERELDE